MVNFPQALSSRHLGLREETNRPSLLGMWGWGSQLRFPEEVWLELSSKRPLRKGGWGGGVAGKGYRQREPGVMQCWGEEHGGCLAPMEQGPCFHPEPCPSLAPAHDVSEPLEVGGREVPVITVTSLHIFVYTV